MATMANATATATMAMTTNTPATDSQSRSNSVRITRSRTTPMCRRTTSTPLCQSVNNTHQAAPDAQASRTNKMCAQAPRTDNMCAWGDSESEADKTDKSVEVVEQPTYNIVRGSDMPVWMDAELDVANVHGPEQRAIPLTLWDTFHNSQNGLACVYGRDEPAVIIGKRLNQAAATRGTCRNEA